MAAALDLCAMDEKLDINYSPTISATLDQRRKSGSISSKWPHSRRSFMQKA